MSKPPFMLSPKQAVFTWQNEQHWRSQNARLFAVVGAVLLMIAIYNIGLPHFVSLPWATNVLLMATEYWALLKEFLWGAPIHSVAIDPSGVQFNPGTGLILWSGVAAVNLANSHSIQIGVRDAKRIRHRGGVFTRWLTRFAFPSVQNVPVNSLNVSPTVARRVFSDIVPPALQTSSYPTLMTPISWAKMAAGLLVLGLMSTAPYILPDVRIPLRDEMRKVSARPAPVGDLPPVLQMSPRLRPLQ